MFTAPDRRDAALLLAAALLVSTVGTVAVWRIATRAQPAGSEDDIVVDEAIRTMATTRAMSGWGALMFIIAGYLAPHGAAMERPSPTIHTIIVVAATVGALASWAWVPTRIVPRSEPVHA